MPKRRLITIVAGAVFVLLGVVVMRCNAKQKDPQISALEKGLRGVLGNSFEYLDGQVGWTKAHIGSAAAERFWFARVRAKSAGEFTVRYEIKFNYSDEYRKSWPNVPERARYSIPIKIGARGAPRVFRPGRFGGSSWPHANVGDTLIIPIHIDRFRTGHVFIAPEKGKQPSKSFFSVMNRLDPEKHRNDRAKKPKIRNDAAEVLDILTSMGDSSINRPGTSTSHGVTALIAFKKPGEFNLAGRLIEADNKAVGRGVSMRVCPKNAAVTVFLEYCSYSQYSGKFTSSSSGEIPAGTIEVRIGDRIVVPCGGYKTSGMDRPKVYRPGAVLLRPFKPMPHYSLKRKK